MPTWQNGAAWSFDPDLVTEVEIRFEPDAAARARWSSTAASSATARTRRVRDLYASEGGWPGLPAPYAARVA